MHQRAGSIFISIFSDVESFSFSVCLCSANQPSTSGAVGAGADERVLETVH